GRRVVVRLPKRAPTCLRRELLRSAWGHQRRRVRGSRLVARGQRCRCRLAFHSDLASLVRHDNGGRLRDTPCSLSNRHPPWSSELVVSAAAASRGRAGGSNGLFRRRSRVWGRLLPLVKRCASSNAHREVNLRHCRKKFRGRWILRDEIAPKPPDSISLNF